MPDFGKVFCINSLAFNQNLPSVIQKKNNNLNYPLCSGHPGPACLDEDFMINQKYIIYVYIYSHICHHEALQM